MQLVAEVEREVEIVGVGGSPRRRPTGRLVADPAAGDRGGTRSGRREGRAASTCVALPTSRRSCEIDVGEPLRQPSGGPTSRPRPRASFIAPLDSHQVAGDRQLRAAAEALGDGLELVEQRVQPLAGGASLARAQIEQRRPPRRTGTRASGSPRCATSRRQATPRRRRGAPRATPQRMRDGGHRRGVGDGALRVGDAHLERPVQRVRTQLPPPPARVADELQGAA